MVSYRNGIGSGSGSHCNPDPAPKCCGLYALHLGIIQTVSNPIPGSVFIGDRIKNGPDTGYRYRIAPPNPSCPIHWDWIGWSDPIPIPGIGSIFDPIPDKYRSGDRICYILGRTPSWNDLMGHIRGQSNLKTEQKAQIDGMLHGQVARIVGSGQTTVPVIVSWDRNRGTVETAEKSGRP
ncbi:hypothetical protein PGT21_025739 [Puccinia graminis f. sp. tritici]|uniref:Uncharacterized protein n=1 Tax=Puccinia graminis f. sp. tritici TaxID=56615 RepID=A0A5B0N5C7_PUCGR|nr:hypothetical protein PGT21_025739 [Puccinia graminis f. sp. tritici]